MDKMTRVREVKQDKKQREMWLYLKEKNEMHKMKKIMMLTFSSWIILLLGCNGNTGTEKKSLSPEQQKAVLEQYKQVRGQYLDDNSIIYSTIDKEEHLEGGWELIYAPSMNEMSWHGIEQVFFYYYPKTALGCQEVIKYSLIKTSPDNNEIWQYKSQAVTITLEMVMDDSAFGYHMKSLEIVNVSPENCLAPESKKMVNE